MPSETSWLSFVAVGVWPVLIVVLVILFKDELRDKLRELRGIHVSPKGIVAQFDKLGKLAEKGAVPQLNVGDRAGLTVGPETAVYRYEGAIAERSARDLVLEGWGIVKQIVYDAAARKNIRLTPATTTPAAVGRLLSAEVLSKDLAELINVLYDIGKDLAEHPRWRPDKDSALVYKEFVDNLVDWMLINIVTPQTIVEPPPPPPPPRTEPPKPRRRQTAVGSGYFPPPAPGKAAAILVGVSGPLRGQQIPMDKDVFRIGASPENDLCITNDEYVSGVHASLRYDKGSVLVSDQHSRNGTFVNENQLTDAGWILSAGDRIRVGASTLEVSQAPGR